MEEKAVSQDSAGMEELLAPVAEGPKVEAAVAAGRAEIDTSAPFLSVREAVDRFGGIAVWKSQLRTLFHPVNNSCSEDNDEIINMEEQAEELEKDLLLKERETLSVLQELEMTKKMVDELKVRIAKEASEVNHKMPAISSDDTKGCPISDSGENDPHIIDENMGVDVPSTVVSQSPELILLELKQAKQDLTRTTSDLAGIQTSINILNMKIEEEKLLLGKSQEKLTSNADLISLLEAELDETTARLQKAKDLETEKCKEPQNVLQEIDQMNTEIEQSKKTTEAAMFEVSKLTSEIERTKANIRTAEIRWLAAKKMEEAAKAAEAMALSDIKALMGSNNLTLDLENACGVTLSVEEYMTLASKAQEADQKSRQKVEADMIQLNEISISQPELLMKVEEATAEAKKCKKELEDALNRVEVANRVKLEVEDALCRWRSGNDQKSYGVINSSKFKNYAAQQIKDSCVPSSGLLSIGQILSLKLMGPGSPEESERGGTWNKENEKPTLSLGQMLDKRNGLPSKTTDSNRLFSAKRKKLGFISLQHILAKQSKRNKKKRHT